MLVDAGPSSLRALRRRRLKLLQRIGRSYAIITEPIRAGAIEVQFTRIADPNRVLDEVAMEEDLREKATGRRKREDELHLPYWAELWDSSLGMASFLVEQWSACGRQESAVARIAHRSMMSKQPASIMDLGCGMGLTGTFAARLGACVLFADLETPALLFAELNSLANASCCRTRKVNWQTDRLNERFDLILGADIVYDRTQWAFLEPFFAAHLAPGGGILLGEPGRSSGEEFETWIASRGWQIHGFTQPVAGGASKSIRLLELERLS
jgi:predicted nicotinamide N-methyase